MQKKLIIGNWKMNPPSVKEVDKIFSDIKKSAGKFAKVEIVLCPPFVYLEHLIWKNKTGINKNKIRFGAQNMFWEESGARTGQISGIQISDLGAKYTIVGHSEARELGESDEDIMRKVKASIRAGLTPILCVGERVRDLEHFHFAFIKNQIETNLSIISKNDFKKIILAYEPVWAIGKNAIREATPMECEEMVIYIRKILHDMFGGSVKDVPIIYGGSINTVNADNFLKNGGVSGLLVGRDSLNAKNFSEILKIANEIK